MSRIRSAAIPVTAVSGSGTKDFSLATSVPINILGVRVEPSIAGGSSMVQFYDHSNRGSGALIYTLGPATGILFDPAQVNSGTITPAKYGFITPYESLDGNFLYGKITNGDTQTKDFDVTIIYEVPEYVPET